MTPNPIQSPPPPSIEAGINALIEDVKHQASNGYHRCEARIRKSPGKAVLAAVAAGYVLHRLPLRAILVTKVRLLTALAPPAMLAFGAAKLCEYLQTQARK